MKFLIFSDLHFCEYSSILRKDDIQYSVRLNNLIKTMNWVEATAIENNCDRVISLGDFFDKPDLNSREITALKEIKWSNIPHTFLVGNHEASAKSLAYNSVNVLKSYGFDIIEKATVELFPDSSILYVPYFLENDRKTLTEYWSIVPQSELDKCKKIVFSHNDVKGIQYGSFLSTNGFDITDIEMNCDLFLNGHLHNGLKFCKNGINIGNTTGQNFSEDAFKYSHDIFILDTVANTVESIENPFAFNFYKLEINVLADLEILSSLKSQSVLSIKCKDYLLDDLKSAINKNSDKIIESRIITTFDSVDITTPSETISKSLSIDYLSRFVEFCLLKIENTQILQDELAEICK